MGWASDFTATGLCWICACSCGLMTVLLAKLETCANDCSCCEAFLANTSLDPAAEGAVFACMTLAMAEPQLGQNDACFTSGAPQRGQIGVCAGWLVAGFAVALAASIAS